MILAKDCDIVRSQPQCTIKGSECNMHVWVVLRDALVIQKKKERKKETDIFEVHLENADFISH